MLYDICRQHGAVKTGYDYRCPKCGTQTYKGKGDDKSDVRAKARGREDLRTV